MPDIEKILDKNIELFNDRKLNCAETVLACMSEYLGAESPLIPRIATAFGGGLSGEQSICGTVTAGLMAIGIKAGREVGGDQMPARALGAEFMRDFRAEFGTLTCMGLTGVDMKDPAQMAAFRAPGGKHYTVCDNCVRHVCRYLAAKLGDEQ